ncbi:PD40 domain-containing protein [Algoriphagus aquimarinus]|uniref:TolB protein n=1 Tax=Algoriphagus aquimarinus TaxID=237018 RepID=A0A5C7AVK7_9BACT|nr:PD40 domain-containing protein [Algoriphagus aquimarinus]TXE12481.1 hypothetical protein ESV85_07600 [Algoriphagus aquimarinus]
MRTIITSLILILIFSSCKKFDDPIPDGSVLEIPTLSTQLMESGKVQLTWTSAQICAGFCPSTVPATTYEIWTKSLTSTTNYKLAETQAGQMSFLVEGLELGVKQEFYVIAKRANVSNKTNRVMVVPNDLPVPESVFQKEGFDYITYPQVSPSGEKIAFAVSKAGGGSQRLFLYDLSDKSEKLISENGRYSSWSANGDKLVFVSNEGNASGIKEYKVASNSVNEIVSDSFLSYFPVFGAGDTTLIYFLDSLEAGDQSIISYNLSEKATTRKNALRDVEDIANLNTPILGVNYSAEEKSIAYGVTYPKETESGFSYDVVGFTMASPSVLKNFVVSDWNDSNPSFSVSEPDLLAFVSDRTGNAQVWIKNISTQQLIQVTDFHESGWINIGIVGLSWRVDKLYVNIVDQQGGTKLLRLDVSDLVEK